MRPGDYPIGSQRSRAAARSLLHFRSRAEAEVRRFTLIMDLGDVTEPSFSPWKSGEDGGLYRVVFIPKGMAEAERITVAEALGKKAKL